MTTKIILDIQMLLDAYEVACRDSELVEAEFTPTEIREQLDRKIQELEHIAVTYKRRLLNANRAIRI